MSCEWKNVFVLLFYIHNFIFALRNLCVYVEIRTEASELMLRLPHVKLHWLVIYLRS